MKRFVSIILTIALLLSITPTGLFCITANAATSGTTGDCTWSLNGTVLTISGYGRMADYTYSSQAPWSYNGITKVVIRSGVTNIGDYAFYYHTNLTTISIPNSVTSIGDFAFMDCSSLTSVEFPDGLTYIGEYVFCNDNITSVTIPDSVTYIGGHAFAYNDISSIVIPSKVTAIADNTFYACKSLTSVTMHDGIVSIGADAFAFNNLSKIIIPDSVTYIGDGAFMWNESLSAVAIGANVKTISTNAFRGCSSLRSVYYRGSQTEKSNISISSYNTDLTNATWYYNSCISTNYHTYTDDCDAECNVCSFTREAHIFTNNCDKDCNICGFIRVPSDHVYDNTCDMACNVCGEERMITHTYSSDSDDSCDICGQTRGPYTITYHLDGGTNAAKNPDVYTEEDIIVLKDASKVGYDFAGWYLDSSKTERVAVISCLGDVDVYAMFTPKSYTATFKDGVKLTLKIADSDKEIYIPYGTTIDPYSQEFMSEHISSLYSSFYTEVSSNDPYFSGWYVVNRNGSKTKLASSLTMTSDTTLYCDFKLDNSSDVPSYDSKKIISMFDGSSTHMITDATFIGNDFYVRVPTLSSGTFKVKWRFKIGSSANHSLVIYNVTQENAVLSTWSSKYNVAGGTTGSEAQITANPGDIIYFSVWTSYGVASGSYIEFSGVSRASSSLTSKYELNKTVYYEQQFNVPTPTPKYGYDFAGWYDTKGNELKYDTWQYLENQTFTPKWQPSQYYISYDLNGGANSPANPSSYTIEDTITLKDPTKPGYTFKGWYSDANFKTQVTSISNKTGNITLYAKWEVNTYNLTLDANNGVWAPKVTFISDGEEIKNCYLHGQDTITAYRPIGKDGYIFAGWYLNSACTSLFKFNGTIANDITLYAKWVECNSNIVNIESVGKFNTIIQGKTEQLYAFVPLVDGKITVTSESNNLDLYGTLYDANKNVLFSADDISSTDLDFTYNYNVKAGQLYYISVKGNTASTTGQAVVNIGWTGNCTITGTTYQNRQLTVAYDTDYELPQKPVREGYVFLGWFDKNDTKITDGTWNFVTDKTLTAKWEEATYHTVVFKDIDGNVISSETYYLSEDIVAPALPIKVPDNTYIYHAKWDNAYTGVCTGDAVYSPVFDAEYIEYTVVFADEDGTELSRGTYHWGDVVTVPAAPAKTPDASYANIYTFAGWDNFVVNCAGDATYTAIYTTVPLKQLVITSQPEKLRYCTGERLDLTGLALQLVYENGTIIPLDSVDAQFVSANTSTAGRKTATITIAGISTEFEIYVHDIKDSVVNVDSSLYPQSSHDYSNNLDETKTFTYPGAESLVITFNSQTSVENNYDYIYVYDGAGNQIAKYTGTTAANKTLTIAGDTFKVRITSDYSNVKYGYAFSSIQANMVNGGEIIHRPVTDPATVTCTQSGLTEGSHCEICGDILVAQEEVAALGHQYKTIFTWSEDHTSCAVTITCERGCSLNEVVDCIVTHSEPHKAQTVHTAVAELDGESFTDILTCDNFLIVFKDWDGTQISSTYYHAGDVLTIPSDPNRLADNTYTYTFAGWDQTVVNCAGNATYTATYTPRYIDYTVVFKDWDGTVLSSKTYHYGDKVTIPSNPTKAADNTYSYVFAGWDKAVVDCTGNATYTATYKSTYINYTVVFKNWDGTVLSTKTYHYGDKVTAPADPAKAADNTYTYTFAGWDKDVVDCTGDATYTATYRSNYIDYTVVFKNWNGDVLSSQTYHYGDKVAAPENPIRPADNTYTYTFKGWDKEIVNCEGDTVYQAVFAGNHYHTYNAKVTPPTCTLPGYTVHTCAGCGGNYTDSYVNALGHSFTSYKSNNDATCTADGTETAKCDRCDATDTRIEEGSALGHNVGAWYVTEKPTCTETGTQRKDCSRCDHFEAEAIAATGHDHVAVVTAPTCLNKGYTTHTCHCGDSYKDSYVNALGHSFTNYKSNKNATCTVDGTETAKCDRCTVTDTRVEKNSAKGHDEIAHKAKTPTCTEIGWDAYVVCSRCNYSTYKEIAATGHSYTSTVVKPTFADKGYTQYTCHCGDSYRTDYTAALTMSTPTVSIKTDTTGKQAISWNSIGDGVVYEIYRATKKTGTYTKVATVADTSWTDTTSTGGTTYYYKVKAVYAAQPAIASDYSNIVSKAGKCTMPYISVENDAKGKPKLTWSKISGAKKYTVYRATSETGKYSKLGTTTKAYYTDSKAKSGTTYFYKIIANASKSTYNSLYSNIVSCNVICGTPSITVKIDSNTGKPSLSWKKVDGAAKYAIYRDVQLLATTTGVSYADKAAAIDTQYTYTVQALGKTESLNGKHSNAVTATSGIAKPVLVGSINGVTGKPVISWQAVEGAVKYELYRSTKSTKSYTLLATVDTLSYTDETVSAGKTYYYKVKAIGEVSKSAESSYVKLTGKCATPVITVSVSESSGKPVLTWEKISGAKKYTVYYATSATGKYKSLGTTTKLTYTHTKATAGTVYFYKIVANASSSKYNSPYSNIVSCGVNCAAPAVKVSLNSSGKPVISWGKVTGAVRYEIYKNGQLLTTVTTTGYTDTAAQAGESCSYTVKAINNIADYNSAMSNGVTVTATCATPKITGKVGENKKPVITWAEVEGATKYIVYRSTSSSKNYKVIGETEAPTYEDLTAAKSKTYYYKVVAVGDGFQSAQSGYAKVKSK